MADLEGEIKPIVEPMMSRLTVRLHEADQRLVAFWALKTAITLQEANRHMYEARVRRPADPPSQVTVWLTRHRGPSIGLAYLVGSPTAVGTNPSIAAQRYRYWIAFRFGTLAFHIFGHSVRAENVLIRHNPASLLQVWPPASPLVFWPPPVAFDDAGFEEMARKVLPGTPWGERIFIPPLGGVLSMLSRTTPDDPRFRDPPRHLTSRGTPRDVL